MWAAPTRFLILNMANRNDAVIEILKLAYELEHSVSRPDAAGWFLKTIYVPTALDERLRPDIEADQFDLVLVTGNPGDGKSAFLGHLANAATKSGRSVCVRHDATEPLDRDDRTASALSDLTTFLAPVSDQAWEPADRRDRVYVVGINKGLLARAFLAPDCPFSRIRPAVDTAMRDGKADVEGLRIAVIDLNKRSEVQLPLESNNSLFDRLLGKLTASALWEERGCSTCDDRGWCPFFGNVRALRRDPPRARLKLLWLILELQSERHATIRDLLAALAYLIVGHEDMFRQSVKTSRGESDVAHPCAFVERESAAKRTLAASRRFVYLSAFVDDDVFEGKVAALEAEAQRPGDDAFGMAPSVVRELLNTLDPASLVSNEYWDAIESSTIADPIAIARSVAAEADAEGCELESALYQRFADSLDVVGRRLDELEPSDSRYPSSHAQYQWLCYLLIKLLKRRAFFYDKAASIAALTRFESLSMFVDALQFASGGFPDGIDAHDEAQESIIPSGLMRSDGLEVLDDRPRELRIRWSAGRRTVGAVLRLPLKDAHLEPDGSSEIYIEWFPHRLSFSFEMEAGLRRQLSVSLETFEGLFRLAKGSSDLFAGVPRTSQLKNFREELRSVAVSEMTIIDSLHPERDLRVTIPSDGRVGIA